MELSKWQFNIIFIFVAVFAYCPNIIFVKFQHPTEWQGTIDHFIDLIYQKKAENDPEPSL